jgi:hypothetical protein
MICLLYGVRCAGLALATTHTQKIEPLDTIWTHFITKVCESIPDPASYVHCNPHIY